MPLIRASGAVLVLLLGVSGCAPESVPPAPGIVQGVAQLDGASSNAGITVVLGGTALSVTTGVDGAFEFTNVPHGMYTCTGTAEGYFSASDLVTLYPAQTLTAPTLVLVPVSGTLPDGGMLPDGGSLVKLADPHVSGEAAADIAPPAP